MLRIFGIFENSLEDYLKMARTKRKPHIMGRYTKVGEYYVRPIRLVSSTLYEGESDYKDRAKACAEWCLAGRLRDREAIAAVDVKYYFEKKLEWGDKTFVICRVVGKTIGKSPLG